MTTNKISEVKNDTLYGIECVLYRYGIGADAWIGGKRMTDDEYQLMIFHIADCIKQGHKRLKELEKETK